MRGTIQRLRTERGFGFIRAADGRQIFFHRRALTTAEVFDTLRIGLAVEFDLQANSVRLRAARLTVLPDLSTGPPC
jgi:cold shock CspA family protein